jgi:hypothetical protein
MISASKTTFIQFNLKILRPKVTQNIKNLRKKFCESAPCCAKNTFNGFLKCEDFKIINTYTILTFLTFGIFQNAENILKTALK